MLKSMNSKEVILQLLLRYKVHLRSGTDVRSATGTALLASCVLGFRGCRCQTLTQANPSHQCGSKVMPELV